MLLVRQRVSPDTNTRIGSCNITQSLPSHGEYLLIANLALVQSMTKPGHCFACKQRCTLSFLAYLISCINTHPCRGPVQQ